MTSVQPFPAVTSSVSSQAINEILKVPAKQLTIEKIRELIALLLIEMGSKERAYQEMREDECAREYRLAKEQEIASFRNPTATFLTCVLIAGQACSLVPVALRPIGDATNNPFLKQSQDHYDKINNLFTTVLGAGKTLQNYWENSVVGAKRTEAQSNGSLAKDFKDKHTQEAQRATRKVDDSQQEFNQIANNRQAVVDKMTR